MLSAIGRISTVSGSCQRTVQLVEKVFHLDENIARVDVKEPCTFSATKPA